VNANTIDRAVRLRVDELAGELGRLRRLLDLEPGSATEYRFDRVCGLVDLLDVVVQPTAAELVATIAPGDDQAVVEAIATVDRHAARLRRRLGLKAAA
jgi:hypothetical protein